MTTISDDLITSRCCLGVDCWAYGNDQEPCWGAIECIDEVADGDDYAWVHSCEGHWDPYNADGKPYRPPQSTDGKPYRPPQSTV